MGEKMRVLRGKVLAVSAAVALVMANIMPVLRVFALENGGDYAEIFMRGAVSVETEGGISFGYNGGTVTVEGATEPVVEVDENWNYGDHTGTLYKFYTKSESLVFTPTAENGGGVRAFLGVDGNNQEVSLTDGHYTLENLVTKGASGPTYDMEFQFNGGGGGEPQPQPQGNAAATLDYTYTGVSGVDFWLNDRFIPMGDAEFDGNNHTSVNVDYNQEDGAETVEMRFETLWVYVIDGLTVNGVDYTGSLPTGRDALMEKYDGQQHLVISLNIPIANNNTYIIETNTHEIREEEIFMGNFLWDNDTSKLDGLNEGDERRDDIIGHGSLEFVKASYKGVTYNSVDEMKAAGKVFSFEQDPKGDGGATFPVGTELTVRLLPEPGYQLTSFGINGGEFEPQENVGEYTFTIRPGNGHFAADFKKVEDEVSAGAEAVESGSITLGEGELDYGTAVLEVEDADLSEEDVAGFADAAGDYQISTYLDISLYQVTYKGTNSAEGAWKDELRELENDAVITLQLEEGVDGNEIVIVHQKHDGTYEVIPTVYDPVARTITFRTSSFSNYAIATMTSSEAKSESESSVVGTPDTGVMTALQGGATVTGILGVVIVVSGVGAKKLKRK